MGSGTIIQVIAGALFIVVLGVLILRRKKKSA